MHRKKLIADPHCIFCNSLNSFTMAAKITLISPFDQASGNISGKQVLKYAENNNPAYDAPVGKVNYARNYRTRYIAGIRSATGVGYLQVRKKSAVNLTTRSKKAMALLGGSAALYSAYASREATRAKMVTIFEYAQSHGSTWEGYTFRKYWMEQIRSMLANKRSTISVTIPTSLVIYNPWVYTGSATIDPHVSDRILVKFWSELATNPISNKIQGMMFVAHSGNTFNDIITSNYNVLGLTKASVSGSDYVKLEDMFVQSVDVTETPVNPAFVQANEAVYNTGEDVTYILTTDSPE